MENLDYFKRQEELMKLENQLRILKRNRNTAHLKRQLKLLNEMCSNLQEKIPEIAANMNAVSGSTTAIQEALDHPVKINLGKENVQSVKHLIETIPQITSNISNIDISQKNEFLNPEQTDFLQNISSSEKKHQELYESSLVLVSNIAQLTGNGKELIPLERNGSETQQEMERGSNSNASGDSLSFSSINVIASSPIISRSNSHF